MLLGSARIADSFASRSLCESKAVCLDLAPAVMCLHARAGVIIFAYVRFAYMFSFAGSFAEGASQCELRSVRASHGSELQLRTKRVELRTKRVEVRVTSELRSELPSELRSASGASGRRPARARPTCTYTVRPLLYLFNRVHYFIIIDYRIVTIKLCGRGVRRISRKK